MPRTLKGEAKSKAHGLQVDSTASNLSEYTINAANHVPRVVSDPLFQSSSQKTTLVRGSFLRENLILWP